ncbi:amidohydrolase family protein [Caulobacter sp. BE254]|uniref:amidohydrolase family protein n=1 Tax=Caulobacter sp. BE254 TaxID=2817720 RepID=UPI00285D8395|nr:amidohydrolase family protein [Caulobacter sp. BE254]MDR7114589.1 L-fuconolactonase [Caulobacter sp. BE254]
MLIDAHQHFWRVGENGFSWPTPDLAAIHRDFGPADLAAVAAPLGLAGCVLVQSQPDDRDTDWLLALAADEPRVLGVVGWVDLASPDAPARIAQLSRHPKLRGLRPMLQSLDDDAWIAAPGLDPALDAMVAHGLSLDALVLTRHLPHLLALARRRPELAIVIDHGAKPPIAAGDKDGAWARGIDALAAQPQVFCKLSGLLTEAAPGQGAQALAPYVAHLVATFGPERLMWGSDWPVLNLAGDYGGWLALAKDLSGLTDAADLAALFGGTSRRFYRI